MKWAVRRVVLLLVGLAVIAAIAYAFIPQPVTVDVAVIDHGSLRVTVDEEGQTRVIDRYTVSSPLAGWLRRITLDPGDPVETNFTLLAMIDPVDPALLDVRAQAEAEARVQAAEANVQRTEAQLQRAQASLDFAQTELNRITSAARSEAVSIIELDRAELAVETAQQDVQSARFAREIAAFELEQARSALLRTYVRSGEPEEEPAFEIRSPITGVVLRVLQRSAGVVTAGTELLELGDLNEMEVVVDVLSNDGAQIERGAPVVLEHWGGAQPLQGVVRLVEPSAFTKISALGVEEQRVNVIVDITTPLEERRSLGDGFRVEARIVLWEADNVVIVPNAALFRRGSEWAVFVVENGRAALRIVQIGQQSQTEAQVFSGLEPGETVIIHPGDRISNGVRITSSRL